MPDVLFSSSGTLSALTGYSGQFVAVGVAVGFIGWVVGYVVFVIIDALRY